MGSRDRSSIIHKAAMPGQQRWLNAWGICAQAFSPTYENMTPIAQAVALPRHLAGLRRLHLERQRVYEGLLLAMASLQLEASDPPEDPRITFT